MMDPALALCMAHLVRISADTVSERVIQRREGKRTEVG